MKHYYYKDIYIAIKVYISMIKCNYFHYLSVQQYYKYKIITKKEYLPILGIFFSKCQ